MFKQVIVVRGDLQMSPGKFAAQVSHASLAAALRVKQVKEQWFDAWLKGGQKKVVLKAKDLEELGQIKRRAIGLGIVVEEVVDRGLTELPPSTITCIAIGPAPEKIIDKVTGELPLFK